MIHTARSTGKFIKLVRWLRVEMPDCPVSHETVAVGILERLWHFTMTSHRRGDVGQSCDDVIAEAVGWTGEAGLIVRALIECKWLLEVEEHRLIVNDWQDHAPTHIKRNAPKFGGLIDSKCHLVEAKRSKDTFSSNQTTTSTLHAPTPNLTKPNLTQPVETNAVKSPRSYPDWFEEFWTAYPPNDKGRKRGKSTTFKLACKIPSEDRSELVTAAKNYKRDQGGEFIRDPERFVKADWWRDHVGDPVRERVIQPQRGISLVDSARCALIKKYKVNEARDWTDERILLEFDRLENTEAAK